MRELSDSKAIFEQLADVDGAAGVQSIIENHDAWVHSPQIQAGITAALRAQAAGKVGVLSEVVKQRIQQQRRALGNLVTVLPRRMSSAG